MKSVKKFFWVVLSVCTMTSASGDNSVTPEVKLDEYVVTASKIEEPLKNVSVPLEIITNEDIKNSSALNLGDLLGKRTTGNTLIYNGLNTQVGLRGFRSDSLGDDIKGHVLVLIDGHRIGTGNIAKINLDRIERIEIIKGPASALYGSAAMGGVVNLITKKGEGEIKHSVKETAGSFGYQKSSLESGGTLKNKSFQYHAAASYEDGDDYKDPEFGRVYNTSFNQKNYGINLTFNINDTDSVRIGGNYSLNKGGYPSWLNYVTYAGYMKENSDYYEKNHSYIDLSYNASLLKDILKSTTTLYSLNDKNKWFYGGAADPDSSNYKNTDTTKGFEEQLSLISIPGHTVILGFAYEQLEKDTTALLNGFPSLPSTPSMEYKTKSLYLQDSISLFEDRLNIGIGARHDSFALSTTPPETGEYLSFVEKEENFDELSPKFGAAYKVRDNLIIKSNIGKGFKTPSAEEISAEFEIDSWGHAIRTLGNRELKPETSITYDFGLDFFNEYLNAFFTFFHTDYKDKIIVSYDLVTYKEKQWTTWVNEGEAEIEGLDLNLEYKLNSLFRSKNPVVLYSNFTYNTKYKDKEADRDLLYVSEYEAKSGLKLIYKDCNINISYILEGPQQIQDYNNWYELITEDKKSFDYFDLNIDKILLDKFHVYFNISNLFDEKIEWVKGYLMQERNYKLGISYDF